MIGHQSIRTQDTTVALTIRADQLAALMQQLCAAEPPAMTPRIVKAAGYLLAGHYRATAALSVYAVRGAEGHIYHTTSGTCDCPWGQRHPEDTCCHQFGARLISGASAIAAFDRAQARWELTLKGTRALAACGRA